MHQESGSKTSAMSQQQERSEAAVWQQRQCGSSASTASRQRFDADMTRQRVCRESVASQPWSKGRSAFGRVYVSCRPGAVSLNQERGSNVPASRQLRVRACESRASRVRFRSKLSEYSLGRVSSDSPAREPRASSESAMSPQSVTDESAVSQQRGRSESGVSHR